MKADSKSDESEVFTYLANYFDFNDGKINEKYTLCIQFREKKIKCFSNLQQGSKIKKYNKSTQDKHFGSVGMFLHDDNGSNYFTTCAHVIGKNAHAFNPDDNSRIGVNIFAIYSGEVTSSPFFDLSVVKIVPESNLTCTFGLKSITGDFTHFRVFRGDILEVRNRRMYIWGASDSSMRSGKCSACEDDDGFISFRVDTKHFAKPGDSGSIICIGDQVRTCYAAFILVGIRLDSDIEEFVAFKVSDAIDMIKDMSLAIEPHLVPKFNVQITNSSYSNEQGSPKRKYEDTSMISSSKKTCL